VKRIDGEYVEPKRTMRDGDVNVTQSMPLMIDNEQLIVGGRLMVDIDSKLQASLADKY
jgi:hypothetical protein